MARSFARFEVWILKFASDVIVLSFYFAIGLFTIMAILRLVGHLLLSFPFTPPLLPNLTTLLEPHVVRHVKQVNVVPRLWSMTSTCPPPPRWHANAFYTIRCLIGDEYLNLLSAIRQGRKGTSCCERFNKPNRKSKVNAERSLRSEVNSVTWGWTARKTDAMTNNGSPQSSRYPGVKAQWEIRPQ